MRGRKRHGKKMMKKKLSKWGMTLKEFREAISTTAAYFRGLEQAIKDAAPHAEGLIKDGERKTK
jgi:hypothetical protein